MGTKNPAEIPQENDMDMHELAALLNGRGYGSEITQAEADAAKTAGLVVAYGVSDDIAVLRGAVNDEFDAYYGATATVFSTGRAWGQELPFDGGAQVVFSPEPEGNLSWRVIPKVPFAPFTINLDGEPFCEGAVFRLADCRPVAVRDMLVAMLAVQKRTDDYPKWLAEAARAALASLPKGE